MNGRRSIADLIDDLPPGPEIDSVFAAALRRAADYGLGSCIETFREIAEPHHEDEVKAWFQDYIDGNLD